MSQYYDLHCTTRAEREALVLGGGQFTWKEVSPHQVVAINAPKQTDLTLTNHRTKSLVWEEDTGEFRDMYFRFMYDVLDAHRQGRDGEYVRLWGKKMDATSAFVREARIYEVYDKMKRKGFIKDAGDWEGVCVEKTGERMDGSYRSAIACYLGIEKIMVKEYAFHWQSVTREFLERKLKADWLQNGLDYYAIDFGEGLKNYEGGPRTTHLQNVNKWEYLKGIVGETKGKKFLDLGCNAGYHSIQLAMLGAKVKGVDFTLTGSANLYKLVYEWLNKRSLDVEFENGDIRSVEGAFDTVICLNTHYHLPPDRQDMFIRRMTTLAPRLILQGNNNKAGEYQNVTGEAMRDMCLRNGWRDAEIIKWEDKPFVLARL